MLKLNPKIMIATGVFSIFWLLLSVFFATLSFVVYTRLSNEKPIASVYFEKDKEQIYRAYIIEDDETSPDEYKIYGDQWRIDAQFIKMKSWANIFGLDAQYNLERFEGRHKNIKDQNSKKNLSHDLGESKLIEMPQIFIDYNFIMDAEYGSSSYQTISTSRIYTIFRTQSGIIIRAHKKPNNLKKGSQGFINYMSDILKLD